MKIFLNGSTVEVGGARTVLELIRAHDLSPEITLVERNGAALPRREWAEQPLRANDRIEILQVAAGG